jgi:hypothetical protein
LISRFVPSIRSKLKESKKKLSTSGKSKSIEVIWHAYVLRKTIGCNRYFLLIALAKRWGRQGPWNLYIYIYLTTTKSIGYWPWIQAVWIIDLIKIIEKEYGWTLYQYKADRGVDHASPSRDNTSY